MFDGWMDGWWTNQKVRLEAADERLELLQKENATLLSEIDRLRHSEQQVEVLRRGWDELKAQLAAAQQAQQVRVWSVDWS